MSVESREKADQAEQLKKLFQEVEEMSEPQDDMSEAIQDTEETYREIDVLNLPPRKEVHGNNRSRAKLKLQAPFVRLFSVILIIIGLLICAYVLWGDELIQMINY